MRRLLIVAAFCGCSTIGALFGPEIAKKSVRGLRAIGAIVLLGREHGLSSYDTAYLELAMRESVPLASLDRSLRLAAEGSGVSLLGPE